MELLNNLVFICSHSEYFSDLAFCMIMGTACFATAVKLCGIQSTYIKIFKYILAFSAIGLISNFFLLLLSPIEFYIPGASLQIVNMTVVFMVLWTSFYEVSLFFVEKYKQIG